jgi:Tfp pilus assembly protein PilV
VDRIRERLHAEEGISLVEIMVSIVILGIALTAFAGTITSALGTIARDEQYVRANQVAADLVEEIRAQPWRCMGLDTTKPGWSSTGTGGATMVPLPTTAPPAGQPACTSGDAHAGTSVESVDGQQYAVRRQVVWVDDPAMAGAENHKRVVVTLDWTVRGRPYQTTQESLRVPRPTADEVPVGNAPPPPPASCAGQVTGMSITPATVAITPSGLTDEAIVVVVETCAGTTGVTLAGMAAADDLSPRSMVASPTGSTTRWQLSFPVGTPNFSAGTKNWRATATGAAATAGTNTAIRQITFYQQAALPPVRIVSVAFAPSLCMSNQGILYRASTATITVEGIVNAQASVTLRPGPGTAQSAAFQAATATQSTWVLTLATGTDVGQNSVNIAVNAVRTADNQRAAEVQPDPTFTRSNNAGSCPAA